MIISTNKALNHFTLMMLCMSSSLIICVGGAGCRPSSNDSLPTLPAADTSHPSASPDLADSEPVKTDSPGSNETTGNAETKTVEVVVGGIEAFNATLAANADHVVLVDFWATWCGPCVEQFSHTVDLHRANKDLGLRVISVSMDEPECVQDVESLLQTKGAEFFNLLTPYGASEEFAEEFDLRGDVPFYKLYDRKGKLRYTFSANPDGIQNCESIENIDLRLAELLKE